MCLDFAAKVFELAGWKPPACRPFQKPFPHLWAQKSENVITDLHTTKRHIRSDLHLNLDREMTTCANCTPVVLVLSSLTKDQKRRMAKKGCDESLWTLLLSDLVSFHHHRQDLSWTSLLAECLMLVPVSNNDPLRYINASQRPLHSLWQYRHPTKRFTVSCVLTYCMYVRLHTYIHTHTRTHICFHPSHCVLLKVNKLAFS